MSREFVEIRRAEQPKRSVQERRADWAEVETDLPWAELRRQASRCMDCGVPFCHAGCPLGNRIPEWNEAAGAGRATDGWARLSATNPMPEVTGRVCPAPCEDACVLEPQGAAVAIRQVEKQLAEQAFARRRVRLRAGEPSGRRVAVVGSGPAGLAAADRLRRVGHSVVVFERDEAPGGLLRFGIPDFKLGKDVVERRVQVLREGGVQFRCGEAVDKARLSELREDFDAVLLATGAQRARDMPLPGRELTGVHLAMEYLTLANRAVAGAPLPWTAQDQHVVVLGGGDTGADCVGTAVRQGAASVTHLHYKPPPPAQRGQDQPWPFPPVLLRPSSSHEEGVERGWSLLAEAFVGEERLTGVKLARVRWPSGRMEREPGSEHVLRADRVLIAVGFTGSDGDWEGLQRGRLGDAEHRTAWPGVFACGDLRLGAKLVVDALHDGVSAAAAVDRFLRGRTSLQAQPEVAPLTP